MEWQTLFSRPEIIWFLIGLVLIVMEFVLPGLIIIFFGIGAWLTALGCMLYGFGLNAQLAIFIFTSLFALVLLRNYLRRRFFNEDDTGEETLTDEFIGKIVTVEQAIAPGKMGKVMLKGTLWEAKSDFALKKGQIVRIIGKESIVLIVEPPEITG